MKNFTFLIFISILVGMMISCEKEPTTNLYSTTGVYTISNDSIYVLSDAKELLYITNNFSEKAKLDSGDRVYAYFTMADGAAVRGADYNIELVSISKLLLKSVLIVDSENADTLGDDPIQIQALGTALNFLNIRFEFLGNNRVHYVNLARNDSILSADTVNLQVYHDENGDTRAQWFSGYVSFDLKSLENPSADSVVLRVRALGYDNMVSDKYITYKY